MVGLFARFLSLSAVALFAACASAPLSPPAPAPPPPPAPAAPSRDLVTAAAIERVLQRDHRSAENRARDVYRHPLDTLLFFGIRPEMTVAEVWPGAGGWYTEVLAPLLSGGKLYVALQPPQAESRYVTAMLRSFHDKLTARPDLYGKVATTLLGPGAFEVAPPGSCDMVVTFRNLHNWMSSGFAPEALAAMHHALKPGGILGIVEHRADPAKPPDPYAANGYVNEEFAIELIEAAGFALVARSEINANPQDTKDYQQGVWTLPPNYRMGERDRAKYTAIGESDRFTLKFVRKELR